MEGSNTEKCGKIWEQNPRQKKLPGSFSLLISFLFSIGSFFKNTVSLTPHWSIFLLVFN